MGNKLTAPECFEKMGLDNKSQHKLKNDILPHLSYADSAKHSSNTSRLKVSGDRTQWSSEFIDSGTKDYLETIYHAKFQGKKSIKEDELHECLKRLVTIWVEETKRQESQNDPSYNGSSSSAASYSSSTKPNKKRKPDHRRSKSPDQRPTKNLQQTRVKPVSTTNFAAINRDNVQDADQIMRSPTIEASARSIHDIPFQATDDNNERHIYDIDDLSSEGPELVDDVPSMDEIMSEDTPRKKRKLAEASAATPRPVTPETPTRNSKGKAPVRDPPMPPPARPARPAIPESEEPSSSRITVLKVSKRKTAQTPSKQALQTSDGTASSARQRRTLDDIEASNNSDEDDNSSTTPVIPRFPSVESATVGVMSQSGDERLTPPPTVRRAGVSNGTDSVSTNEVSTEQSVMNPDTDRVMMTASPATSRPYLKSGPSNSDNIDPSVYADGIRDANRETREERLLELCWSLHAYIRKCEMHSIRRSKDSDSSERDQQARQAQAIAFSNLEKDIGSRIECFVHQTSDIPWDGVVTEHCLWL